MNSFYIIIQAWCQPEADASVCLPYSRKAPAATSRGHMFRIVFVSRDRSAPARVRPRSEEFKCRRMAAWDPALACGQGLGQLNALKGTEVRAPGSAEAQPSAGPQTERALLLSASLWPQAWQTFS